MRATTFILGVWGHVVEKVVENLGFTMEIHKNSVSLRGQKFKDMALEKILFRLISPTKNYLQHPYFIYAWSRLKSRGTRYFFLALNKC